MRKLLNNRWFVAALAALALAFVWFSLPTTITHGRFRAANASGEDVSQAVSEAQAGVAPALSTREALQQLRLPKAARDPFAVRAAESTPNPEQPQESDFLDTAHLTGIWTQNGSTLVLINEHVFGIGDSIGRLTIESATQEGVWLKHWNGRTFLTLGASFVLKTPARSLANLSGSQNP